MESLIEIERSVKRIFNVLELTQNSYISEKFGQKIELEFSKKSNSYNVKIPFSNHHDINDKFYNDGIICACISTGLPCTFFEVTLMNNSKIDSYIMIISDIIFRSFETQFNLESIIDRYESWRDLIKLINVPKTDIGLWGELNLLDFLIDNNISGVHSWSGPEFSTHDFQIDEKLIEVKSTLKKYNNLISINGLGQLNNELDTALCLIRLEKDDLFGVSLSDLVIKIKGKISIFDRSIFENKLSRFEKIIHESTEKFKISSIEMYMVNDDFPRINKESFKNNRIPKGVSYISYSIDLSNTNSIELDQYFKI